ncbi:hypothetical protein PG984_013811 [Apiospora sp. TS-2023a]
MKLSLLILAATALLASSAVDACTCDDNRTATYLCCHAAFGTLENHDCLADTISERLSNFAMCCVSSGARSICRCPIGCD